jgi:hypothetical protein
MLPGWTLPVMGAGAVRRSSEPVTAAGPALVLAGAHPLLVDRRPTAHRGRQVALLAFAGRRPTVEAAAAPAVPGNVRRLAASTRSRCA